MGRCRGRSVDAGLTSSGRPVAVDLTGWLKSLASLSYRDRYWTQPDGNVLCAWADPSTSHPRLRLATIRRSGLPLLEDAGQLAPLGIGATVGLYEPIHVALFPDNIVGVEFNFYGPRPSRLPSYLRQVFGKEVPTFTLDPLLRQDVTARLARLQSIRVLDLAIRASYVDTVARADASLGAAFAAAREVGTPHLVRLELRPEPYRRDQWLGPGVLRAVRRLATRRDLRENAKAFTVDGLDDDGTMEKLDLLKDHLVSSKRIVRLDVRSRAVNDAAAYNAVEEAYDEQREDLIKAATVVLR